MELRPTHIQFRISNWLATQLSNANTTTFNGTSTITMKDGPVNDVPISIRLMDDSAVSIWVASFKDRQAFWEHRNLWHPALNCVEKAEYCKWPGTAHTAILTFFNMEIEKQKPRFRNTGGY